MGLSMLLGGLRYKEQKFQPLVAGVNASLMNLALIAILLHPVVYGHWWEHLADLG